MANTEITRRAMYDLVWSKPMSKVAEDFGISDVALKKHCEKHRVPTPPRGYWAKKEAGKLVKQVRFVETADPMEERIVIRGGNYAALPEPVKKVLEEARAARAQRKKMVPTDLPASSAPIEVVHTAIAATAKALRKQKPDKDGTVSATGQGHCGLTVGISSTERCITILDALARSCEFHGLQIIPTGKAMTIAASGETVAFRLSEKVRREKHTPTLEELAAEERRRKRMGITWDSPYGRAYAEWDFIRTGDLGIEIENQYADGLRRSWKDGRRQRLENVIDEIAAGLKAYAAAVKLKQEESARRQRNWERHARVRARAEARRSRESERKKILDELAAITSEANKLRVWLHETESWTDRTKPDEFTRFVDWAGARLEYLAHATDPDGIAEILKSRNLFPEFDSLVDPPDDLIVE
jgi:hypothetical protein